MTEDEARAKVRAGLEAERRERRRIKKPKRQMPNIEIERDNAGMPLRIWISPKT